jgi:alkylation response protein AidB-like acyl-CoA dehydrogenase
VSAVLCGRLLAAAGSDEQQARWLPALASGEAIWSVAWLEPDGGYGPGGIAAVAEEVPGGFRLRGTKRHVAFASSASRLLVLARTGTGDEDVDLFAVDPSAPGVRMTQQQSLASDTQYEVVLEGVEVAAGDRVGPARSGWAAWESVMYEAVVLAAAQAMGGARHALDITVQYAKDRHQFDKPLGAFQAIAHYLADAVTAVDGGTSLVHEAAWAHGAGRPEARRLAAMAKLFACQTYRDVTAMAQQVFGGIGFTVEFDIQLYFRRAKVLQLSWWDDRTLEEKVAAAVLEAAGR